MTPGMPLFSPMMPYGSGLTPQPVQNTNSLSILEEQQRQQQQQQAQQASAGTTTLNQRGHNQSSWFFPRNVPFFLNNCGSLGLPGTSGQTPQLFHSQTVTGTTTTALPGNTPLYNTPLTPMTPITPATPASESSGIVPQLQYVENAVWVNSTWCFWHLSAQLSMAEILLSFCAWKYYFCKHCYEVLKTKWHGKVSPSSTLPFLPFPVNLNI